MKAILVDDEKLALDFLEQQIIKTGEVEIIGTFTRFDAKANKELLRDLDIVFLDIEMPEINGLELAELILEINPALEIVFVTAFNEYAVQAFELNALDYLLKPIQSDRLKKTMKRISKANQNSSTQPEEDGSTLYINLCEDLSFNTSKSGNAMALPWRTTKAKELFLYLLQNHEKVTPKSKLVDLLWPDFEEDKAFSQLYTAIYHIRKLLEQFGDHFTLKSIQEGYNLSTQNVKIDVIEWEKKLTSLGEISTANIEEYITTMKLYTGLYLSSNDYSWAEQESYRLEKIWSKAAYDIAEFYQKAEDLENAENWFVKITNARPEEEEAHFRLMEIYASLGLGLLVEHQYTQLKKAFTDLDIQISNRISNWYDIWKTSR